MFYDDRFRLSSLASERFDYVEREVTGYTLDVGCGAHNRFVRDYLGGQGKGIDVYPYEGLTREHVYDDLSSFPFPDASFDTVTFIANVNHIPQRQRDTELREAYRVLKPHGNVVVTMGNPIAEILAHKAVWCYDKLFRTHYDIDSERGMKEGEEYYLPDAEILERLTRSGFTNIRKKYFITQWGLNHLFIGWKQ